MTRVRNVQQLVEQNRARGIGSPVRTSLRGRGEARLTPKRGNTGTDSMVVRARRLLFVLLAALTLAGFWVLRVERIEVDGLHLAERETCEAAVVGALDHRWLTVDTAAIASRLRALPWIAEAQVHRRLPSSIEVDIVECRPVLRLEHEDAWFAVDPEARVMPVPEELDLSSLPALVGVRLDGDGFAEEDAPRVRSLLEDFESGGWPLTSPLVRVELLPESELRLRTDDGVDIRIDSARLRTSLESLAVAWPRLSPNAGDEIDLRFERQVVLARGTRADLRHGEEG